MLTPGHLTTTQWYIFAIIAGVALGVAAMSLATTRKKRVVALLIPLAGAASILGQSAARGYKGDDPPFLFTLLALDLVILRLVFAKWFTHQNELHRAGRPYEEASKTQVAVFILTFVAVTVLVAFLIY
jgi:hypothetical protein